MVNFLFLFRGHRELWEENISLKARIQELERYTYELKNATVQAAGKTDMEAVLEEYRKSVLEEQPFEDNKIPEHMYLTPPYPDN